MILKKPLVTLHAVFVVTEDIRAHLLIGQAFRFLGLDRRDPAGEGRDNQQRNQAGKLQLEDSLDHPSRAILAPEKLVRFFGVCEAQFSRIPEQFLAGQLLAQLHAQRDVAQ